MIKQLQLVDIINDLYQYHNNYIVLKNKTIKNHWLGLRNYISNVLNTKEEDRICFVATEFLYKILNDNNKNVQNKNYKSLKKLLKKGLYSNKRTDKLLRNVIIDLSKGYNTKEFNYIYDKREIKKMKKYGLERNYYFQNFDVARDFFKPLQLSEEEKEDLKDITDKLMGHLNDNINKFNHNKKNIKLKILIDYFKEIIHSMKHNNKFSQKQFFKNYQYKYNKKFNGIKTLFYRALKDQEAINKFEEILNDFNQKHSTKIKLSKFIKELEEKNSSQKENTIQKNSKKKIIKVKPYYFQNTLII